MYVYIPLGKSSRVASASVEKPVSLSLSPLASLLSPLASRRRFVWPYFGDTYLLREERTPRVTVHMYEPWHLHTSK